MHESRTITRVSPCGMVLRLLLLPIGFGLVDSASGDGIYWTSASEDNIKRAFPDGTEIEQLVDLGGGNPLAIAVDAAAGKMYWTVTLQNRIMRSNLDGTAVQELINDLSSPRGLALDLAGQKMYWTENTTYTNRISRANLNGTGIEILIPEATGNPAGIALDMEHGKMYWADWGLPEKIRRANLDGTDIEDLITAGLARPLDVALDVAAGKLYWADLFGEYIGVANLDGSGAQILISTEVGDYRPHALAVDPQAGMIFWMESYSIAGRIRRARLDGTDLRRVAVFDVSNSSGVALDITDCNDNGISDYYELETGSSLDCNANHVPDPCDLSSGTSADCNSNLIPDDCEVPRQFDSTSPQLSPLGGLNAVSFTVVSAPAALGDVSLTIRSRADLDESSEWIDVDINGVGVGSVFAEGAEHCPAEPDSAELMVPAEIYNDAVEGGDAVINLTPALYVNPSNCLDRSFATIRVQYETLGTAEDCNGDNVPDECDDPLPILQQPQDQKVQQGEMAYFNVIVDGTLPVFQWRKDGVDLQDSEHIVGSQSSVLIILKVVPEDAGEYDCIISDDIACQVTSDAATLAVTGPCPADLDDNGSVGAFDLAMLLGDWGPCPDCPADLDGDGEVGPFDLALLLGAWGPCPG